MTQTPAGLARLLMFSKGNTYGTTSTPAGANALRTFDSSIVPMNAEVVERAQDDGIFGRVASPALTQIGSQITTSTYFCGSGAYGVAPSTDLLWRACGASKALATGVTTYSPVNLATTTALDWVDCRLNWAGEDHVGLGARGDFTLNLSAGAIPFVQWVLTGLYTEPTNVALPTPTFPSQATPVPSNAANTVTVTIGGVSVCLNSLTFSAGNTVELLDEAGCAKAVRITNAAPTATMVIQRKELATLNLFSKAASGVTEAVQIVHGPETDRITLNLPKVSYAPPQPADIRGLAAYTVELYIQHDPGQANHWNITYSSTNQP